LKTRYAHVNALLCNAKGERRLFINPKCEPLIKDFRMMSYKENTTEPENYAGTEIGHMSDGVGYAICRLFPMKIVNQATPTVITTG